MVAAGAGEVSRGASGNYESATGAVKGRSVEREDMSLDTSSDQR
jgi:hypothetical protein